LSTGGYINIGMVFSNKQNIVQAFECLTDYITQKGSSFTSVKYSKDADGDSWVEQPIISNAIGVGCLSGYYTEFTLSGEFLDADFKKMSLAVNKEDDYFGFLLRINWEDISPDNLVPIQEHIISILIDLYKTASYEYAFVGHEIEIEIHPDEFEDAIKDNEAYPVGIIGKNDKLVIYYGTIGVDGLSSQEQRKDTITL
jgi:hypothetical protein